MTLVKTVTYLKGNKIKLCLVQVPKCFRPKILVLLHFFCDAQKTNLLNWNPIIFWLGTISLELAQYVNQYLIGHKKFGPAQNTFGPVEGRGISLPIEKENKVIWPNCIFSLFSYWKRNCENYFLNKFVIQNSLFDGCYPMSSLLAG